MAYQTLISTDALKDLLASGADVLVLDCEFDLGEPDKGRAIYEQGMRHEAVIGGIAHRDPTGMTWLCQLQ